MLERHIFLIGMPGCGKSSLGRRAAGDLRLNYMDTDQRVERALQCSTTEIFNRYGEQGFRSAETNMLIQLTREAPSVVSTGGGAVMREVNREIMRNHGVIVLIDRPLHEILGDIKLNRRPLLARKGLGEVERLYYERIDIYRRVADAVLDNSQGYHAGLYGLERLIRAMFNLDS